MGAAPVPPMYLCAQHAARGARPSGTRKVDEATGRSKAARVTAIGTHSRMHKRRGLIDGLAEESTHAQRGVLVLLTR